jgi:hypothetical protein
MTNFLKSFSNRNLFALAAFAAAVAPQALKAADERCPMQNAVMSGTYAVTGSGTIIGVGPMVTVGLVVYNGDGTGYAVSSTSSVNGMSSTSANVPATFTVNRDCTGSKTLGKSHFNFVISPDGSTINWIVTDNGVTISGTAVRLKWASER